MQLYWKNSPVPSSVSFYFKPKFEIYGDGFCNAHVESIQFFETKSLKIHNPGVFNWGWVPVGAAIQLTAMLGKFTLTPALKSAFNNLILKHIQMHSMCAKEEGNLTFRYEQSGRAINERLNFVRTSESIPMEK
jgi:hypothetical protein